MDNNIHTQETHYAWWQISLRGMLMGLADLVPGVSGGTLALILGIYPRFIQALSQFTLADALSLLSKDFKSNFIALWKKVDGWFLLSLFAGIATSIVLFAQLISLVLEYYPSYLFALFFGLIVMSLPWLIKQINTWSGGVIFLLILGVILGAAISLLNPMGYTAQLPLYICFIAGFIVVSAMLMPGLSGSFLLLLFGLYHGFIEAVKSFDVLVIACFVLGAACSFVFFSRFIDWLLRHHWSQTLALLTGLVAGALIKVWPWHEETEWFNVKVQAPIPPFFVETHVIMITFALMIIGAIIAIILLRINRN